MDIHIHVHVNQDVAEALARIEATLANQQQEDINMGAVTDAAIQRIEQSVQNLTNEVESVGALIDGNVQATRDLAAELERDGVDAGKLHALADSIEANRDRLVAMTLRGTPSDPAQPIPPVVPSE